MSRLLSFFSFFRTTPSTPASKRTRHKARLALEQLENRLVPTVSWTGGAGTLNWSDAANWSGHAVPSSADDAIVNVAVGGPIKISGTNAVHSLTDVSASLTLQAGSLSLAAASSISQNLAIQGGTLTSSGSLVVGGALSQSNGVLTGGGMVRVRCRGC